jgi:hypothetical protein
MESRDSAVAIATRYGLEGPGIESRWGEIFRTYPDRLPGPPSLLHNGYRVFPGGKGGRGVMLTKHPILVPRLRKSWVIHPLTLWVLLGLLRGSLISSHGNIVFWQVTPLRLANITSLWRRPSYSSVWESYLDCSDCRGFQNSVRFYQAWHQF